MPAPHTRQPLFDQSAGAVLLKAQRNFGLAMETPAGNVRSHPSGERKRPVYLGPDETPNRKGIPDVNTSPEDTRRLRFGLG